MLVKLKDVCTFESNNFNKKDNWTFVNYLDTSNLTENVIQDFQYLEDLDNLPSRAKRKVKIGDILFSSVRPNQKHYGFIDKEYPNLLVSTGFIVLTPTEKVNNKFLYYWLIQDKTIDILQTKAETSTSAYPSITKEDMYDLEIDLPPLEIQDKIANILSNIDNQIERNNAMTKRLQVLGNTIYSKIMTSAKSKTPKLLGDLVEMYQPETITSDKFVSNGTYPVYGAGGIIGFYDKYNHEEPQLMVSCRGVCGKTEISLPKSFIIGNQMVIKPKNENLKYFLYNYLTNCDLSCVETGSVQKQITRTNLAKLQILLPNEDIISEYYDVFESIYSQKTKIILETEKLNQLKNKLLPLLINGQLSI